MANQPEAGYFLIPDNSGYTEFLHEVELTHASHIVTDLPEALISAAWPSTLHASPSRSTEKVDPSGLCRT